MSTPENTPEEKNEICEKAFKSIYPSCDRKDENSLASLKGILGNGIAERIKNFNHYDKPVLFISDNISLIRGAVAYLWYTHDQVMPPHVLGCSGLKEDEVLTMIKDDSSYWIDSAFTNLEYCTYLGGVLFLEDLNPYENTLNQLWSKYEKKLKELWPKAEDNKYPGILVIGMGNTGNLSQGRLGQFKVIKLEPEKQREPVNISQDKAKIDFVPFPTLEGAKWSDLKITIIGYEKVKLKAKSETITTNYKEMGFEDGRTGKPNNAWKRLTEFANNRGMLTQFSSTEKKKIEKDIQEIRNTLSERFKIDGKPIPDYVKEEGYKTAFKISYQDEREQKSKELSNFDGNKDDIDF